MTARADGPAPLRSRSPRRAKTAARAAAKAAVAKTDWLRTVEVAAGRTLADVRRAAVAGPAAQSDDVPAAPDKATTAAAVPPAASSNTGQSDLPADAGGEAPTR